MFFYNLVVRLYGLAISAAAISRPKARQWVRGRKRWRRKLREKVAALGNKKRIWVHCASYGEFEQGRPLIEALRIKYPDHVIILSFFSPSGYESFKLWEGAALVCYLPLDTGRNARDFLAIIDPGAAIFIKYEFWLNLLFHLKRMQVPTFLVSAVFKPHHPFFKSYGGIFRESLLTFSKLFVQDTASGHLLAGIGIKNFEVCGDTRFDRVLEIKKNFKSIPGIEAFKGTARLIFAGSTWPRDEDLVIATYASLKNPSVKLVLAPHHVSENELKNTVLKLDKAGLSYTLFTKTLNAEVDVMIIDTMGLLARAYAYACCAYIGGGFNEGIHNTLEPAVYGIPVAFYGEGYINFNEAVEMIALGAAFRVSNAKDLAGFINNALNEEQRGHIRLILDAYFEKNRNITGRVINEIHF
jgi:3-deoxy-D-manno-octulosonic-acid transferase